MREQIFSIPNIGKNVKIIEEAEGLMMFYTLPCTESFPLKSFISKKKWYYETSCFIPYDRNMSKRIHYAYNWLKIRTMLSLAEWKHFEITKKVADLKLQKEKFITYVP